MERRVPSRCHCCASREHAAIDLALARHVSARAIARRYRISIDSIYRHAANHLPAQLRAKLVAGPSVDGIDLERLKEGESQSLLLHLVNLRNRLFASLDVAEECGDSGMVARVANSLHTNLETTGRLLGDLANGSTSITNILIAPQYVEMRVALVKALAPYPDAKQAVAKVLHRIESKAAAEIRSNDEKGLVHVSG